MAPIHTRRALAPTQHNQALEENHRQTNVHTISSWLVVDDPVIRIDPQHPQQPVDVHGNRDVV